MEHTPQPGDYQYFKNVGRDQELVAHRRKVKELESGKALEKERAAKEYWHQKYEKEHARHDKDVEAARRKAEREGSRNVRAWQETAFEAEAARENAEAALAAANAKRKADVAAEKAKRKAALAAAKKEIAALKAQIKERDAKISDQNEFIKTLLHRLNTDHTTSDLPSSQDRRPPKKTKRHNHNSRVKTGRKPGAQPGHPHHGRKKPAPTHDPVWHTAQPADTIGEEGWYPTSGFVEKMEVNARIVVDVIPHRATIWRNRITGCRRTSAFPEGLHDETNYSKQTEALVLMLTNTANVANRKVKQMLCEATGGALDVSVGWIAGLPAKFSARCGPEITAIFRDLFSSSFMHVDSTVTKNNGKREAVSVACSPESKAVLLTHTEKKGHEAADSLPCARGSNYPGIVISDREQAFIILGVKHQYCLAHLIRDLQDVFQMEKCSWAEDMISLMREMIRASHAWLGEDAVCDGPTENQVIDFETRYDAILKAGRDYYCQKPPSKHYLDGYGMRKLLAEDKEHVVLFLHEPGIPPTNNMAERACRGHKRALHQAVTFRASKSIDDRCDIDSIVQTARLRDTEIFPLLLEILSRPLPADNTEPSEKTI